MLGWATDCFGKEPGEALTEGLPLMVGCHMGKKKQNVSWFVGDMVSEAVSGLQGEPLSVRSAGTGFVLEVEPRALCILDKRLAT